jgi:hypothetical protein
MYVDWTSGTNRENAGALGDLEVYLRARGPEGTEFVFKSEDQPERTFVSDFGDNLEEGVDRVLDALREYSERRAASPS